MNGKCVPFSIVNQPFNVRLSLSNTSIHNLFDVKLVGIDECATEYKLKCKSGTEEYRLMNYDKHFYDDNIFAISNMKSLNKNLTYTCYVEACLIDNCNTSNELNFTIDNDGQKREISI